MMDTSAGRRLALAVFSIVVGVAATSLQARDSVKKPRPGGRVYVTSVTPHWLAGNTRFWYRNELKDRNREFIAVNAVKGVRARAFDHERLAKALVKSGVKGALAGRLPVESIVEVTDKTVVFMARGSCWRCDLKTYELKKIDRPKPAEPAKSKAGAKPRRPKRKQQTPSPPKWNAPKKWTYTVKDHNIFLRLKEGGDEIQLSKDGSEDKSYSGLRWAPDGRMLIAFRVTPGKNSEVYLVESSPSGGGPAKLHKRGYQLPGDKFTLHELNIFDPETKKQIKPDIGVIDFGGPGMRWKDGGRKFLLTKMDRGYQRFRLIEVDTHTGAVFNVIDEKTDTFIWRAHRPHLGVGNLTWLDRTKEIIYMSERDGFRSLYLVDLNARKIKHRITKGDYVVRYVDKIDQDKREIWFRASGMNPKHDPYMVNYYRINFDGSGLTALTDGNGMHKIAYSPDKKYIVDTYSRVDMAPVNELRRVSDGKLMCVLEKSDTSELDQSGFKTDEVFAAKGRDGKTDIYGIICRPQDFDPKKKYPILEDIYAGPHSSYVPKTFSTHNRYRHWTDMGFIVVKIDGMGTANRSKAFHDMCWRNLKDAGLPDRIAWIKSAAKKYPYMDVTRVGIYGCSAGGQNAAAAVLFHPEFYKAAAAGCGCHDNRMDKSSWNEQWMGYPIGPHYSASSNIDNAKRLKGALMLIVGEMDKNVPPESTIRFVDALIKADKDFDLIFVPGAGHGMGGRYGNRRMQNFFLKHLQGKDPPNRNAQ
jgi:dienelactone hydrolase